MVSTRIELGPRALPAAAGHRGGVRADPPVRRPDHRHRHPPGGQDGGAAADAARRRGQADLDRQPQHHPAGRGGPAAGRGRHRHRRSRPRTARCTPATSAEVLAAEPDLILDNGGDLFARYLDRPYQGLIGGTEETTSGRMRLEPLRGPAQAADPGHQRQPDQAVRGERARRRAERGRVLPADDEPGHQRGAGHRVRLRGVRARGRGQLPRAPTPGCPSSTSTR